MQKSNEVIVVRQATAADITPLCRLISLLFDQEADFEPDTVKQDRGLSLILGHPEFGRIYCATEGHRIAGMVSILFTLSATGGGSVAWLEDMLVHPDWRGHGIGRQLLQEAISQTRAEGCGRITLLTDASNSSSIRFYGRAGFVRSRMSPLRICL